MTASATTARPATGCSRRSIGHGAPEGLRLRNLRDVGVLGGFEPDAAPGTTASSAIGQSTKDESCTRIRVLCRALILRIRKAGARGTTRAFVNRADLPFHQGRTRPRRRPNGVTRSSRIGTSRAGAYY